MLVYSGVLTHTKTPKTRHNVTILDDLDVKIYTEMADENREYSAELCYIITEYFKQKENKHK